LLARQLTHVASLELGQPLILFVEVLFGILQLRVQKLGCALSTALSRTKVFADEHGLNLCAHLLRNARITISEADGEPADLITLATGNQADLHRLAHAVH